MLSSLALAALGALWSVNRLWFHAPGTELDHVSLLPHLPEPALVGVPIVFGLLGMVTGTWGRGRVVTVVAGLQATVFVLVAGDIGVLLTLGYLMALGFPLVLVTLLVVGARRSRTARLGLLGLLAAVTTVVLASDVFTTESVRALGSGLLDGARDNLPPHLVVTFLVVHGLLWAIVGLAQVSGAADRDLGSRSFGPDRWGTPVTVVAAACALPYGVNRMTWLMGGAPAEVHDTSGVMAMGVLLGVASFAAATLTIGLVRPWGRVFPAWLPLLGRRPVPVLLPALAAISVGVVMTVAGKSLLQGLLMERAAGGDPPWSFLFLVPMPVWGPALVAAGYAYLVRSGPPAVSRREPAPR